jgi:nucleoside-diphosphate kinase
MKYRISIYINNHQNTTMTATNHIQKLKAEQTFVMIKPDGVLRGLTGDIMTRIDRLGLKIVAMKMTNATKAKLEAHYPMSDEAWVDRLGEKGLSAFESAGINPIDVLGTNDKTVIGKGVTKALVDYMTAGPVICIVVQGIQATKMVRKLIGSTLPNNAELGSIRGDYSLDSPTIACAEGRSLHNIIHASETVEEAQSEISIWFDPSEICADYKLGNEDIMYSRYY